MRLWPSNNYRKVIKNLIQQCDLIALLSLIVSIFAMLHVNNIVQGGINANDLNGNIGGFGYVIQMLKRGEGFPTWNPYLFYGLPVIADPLNIIFSPFIFTPYMLFEYIFATKVALYLVFIFSSFAMYFLLKTINKDSLFNLLLSLTYSFAGYTAAQLVSGHIEKLIAYSLLPLLITSGIQLFTNKSRWSPFFNGLILLVIFLSGGIYEIFYYYLGVMTLFITCIILVLLQRVRIKVFLGIGLKVILATAVWLSIGAFKIVPMLESIGYIERSVDPYSGSLSLYQIAYSLFAPPIGSWFEKIESMSPFFWWENAAYVGIGLLAVIVIVGIMAHKKGLDLKLKLNILIVMLLLISNFLYISIDILPISPYKRLFELVPKLKLLRLPSRSLSYTIAYLCLVCGYYWSGIQLNKYKKNILLFVLLVNLVGVLWSFHQTTTPVANFQSFPKSQALSADLLSNFAPQRNYIVAQHPIYSYQPHLYSFIYNKYQVLNPNYGFALKGASLGDFTNGEFNSTPYDGPQPRYIIYPEGSKPVSMQNVELVKNSAKLSLFENKNYTPIMFSSLQSKPKYTKVDVAQDSIPFIFSNNDGYTMRLKTNSNSAYIHTLISNYPGWTAYIDGKETSISRGNLITIKALKGPHTYRLIFLSELSRVTLIFSLCSCGLLIAYVLAILHMQNWAIRPRT